MSFVRQYAIPFLIVLVFLVALLATSARHFLPGGLGDPVPIADRTSISVVPDLTSGER